MEALTTVHEIKIDEGQLIRLRIRPMERKDLLAAEALEKKCFSDPWNMKMLEGSLTAAAETAFAAEICTDSEDETSDDAKQLVGYMSLMHAADEGELLRIAVEPSFRRKGIADIMMETMAEWAAARNIVSIFLEVRSKNEGAIALYEKHGFEKIGLRKNYYHDPDDHACIMKS